MNENYEESWEYLDPISNEEIIEHITKGRALPILDDNDDLT
jgi:hypothetical protein